MGVCVESHCVYGYCVSVEEFEKMIDLTEYDSLFDWIDDYNRYEWCIWDEYNDCVYFGVGVGYSTNSMELPLNWIKFKHKIEDDVKLDSMKEERPHFHVFNIWDC